MAETVIAELNGATRVLCPQFHGARIESMVELLDNGTGRGMVKCAVTVHGSNDLPAIAEFLKGEAAPINATLPALKADKDVRDALYYLGAEGNVWANLYKVSEIVEDRAGGVKAIFQKCWCSHQTWHRFRRTANHQEAIGRFSRHARTSADPPPDPMTEPEARLFAREMVKKWLESITTEQKQDACAQS